MRRIKFNNLQMLLMTLLALTALLLSQAGRAESYFDLPKDDIYNTKERRYGHLEYMGFYASAMRHWNYTEELAAFTNITWIETRNLDTAMARLREAREVGVQAVLSIQAIAFDSDYLLRDNYAEQVSILVERIQQEALMDTVAMVYPIDEPMLHARNSPAVSRSEMRIQLHELNTFLTDMFPSKPLGVIYHHKEVFKSDFEIPADYDWIGFDCYESLWNCNGRPFTDYYGKLLEVMTDEQMLMAVPESWIRERDYERGSLETREVWEQRKERMIKNLRKRLKHHYEIALNEPRFVAFIPFLWSMDSAAGAPEASGFGVDQFLEKFPAGGEAYIRALTDIGQQIKHQRHVNPNLRWKQTEFSFFRRESQYAGEILDVSARGKVSAWAIDSALPHKNLRMQIAVYQEGELVYLSKPKRSFVMDREISSAFSDELPATGTHGYRHTLPRDLFNSLAGKFVEIELRVLPDRAGPDDYYSARYDMLM